MMIGERIKTARKRAGLSQRDLGERANVSAMAISKYERGMDIPSSGVLIRLAKALGVTTEYFVRPIMVKLSTPSYRCRAALPKKQENAILAEAQDCVERYLEIESLFDETIPFELPKTLNPTVATLEDAERVAVELRQAWQLGLSPIENLIEVLEAHGIKIVLVAGHEKFDACTFWANESMPVIAVKCDLPGDRQRFTLAHELGHLILHVQQGIDPEKVANRFAGAFLVPKHAVSAELGPSRHMLSVWELHLLKHKYGLSMQGWIYRAQDLKIISDSVARQLFARFRRSGWHQQEPGDQIPPERPQRMERLVMRAVAEDLISESRASELLGKPLSKFLKEEATRHAGIPAEVCP